MKQRTAGALIVTVVILALFSAHVLGWAPPLDAGTSDLLKTALTLVLGYWIGSSSSSAGKDEAITNAAVAAHETAMVTADTAKTVADTAAIVAAKTGDTV